jgi:hypothetical protein
MDCDSDPVTGPKAKRRRYTEFDSAGEWVDVRRFDRMPITTESASEIESMSGTPPGTYFISLARKRITGIINLHNRWLKKIKNKKSPYAAVQFDLLSFYTDMLGQFDRKYGQYTSHPMFDAIGMTRKRDQ